MSYQVAQVSAPDDIEAIRSTIFLGYITAGILLILLGWLYRYDRTKRIIDTLFPPTIMGPAISLIGLELSNMAAQDSGFVGGGWSAKILAISTLVCIIIFSLLKHHFLQNASILIGILFGCILATIMDQVAWPIFQDIKIQIPKFYFPSFNFPSQRWITLVIAIFPCSMIAFIESLGRLSVYEGMLKRDELEYSENISNSAILAHSFSNILTSITNMMPSAVYAENLAIMNLHSADLSTKSIKEVDEDTFINNCYSTYSIYPYVIASAISIIVALFSGLQNLFTAIPMPILGGMELFVFGLIAAPGIQMLVEQQVNYKKYLIKLLLHQCFWLV